MSHFTSGTYNAEKIPNSASKQKEPDPGNAGVGIKYE